MADLRMRFQEQADAIAQSHIAGMRETLAEIGKAADDIAAEAGRFRFGRIIRWRRRKRLCSRRAWLLATTAECND
jgi:hypothetical protein